MLDIFHEWKCRRRNVQSVENEKKLLRSLTELRSHTAIAACGSIAASPHNDTVNACWSFDNHTIVWLLYAFGAQHNKKYYDGLIRKCLVVKATEKKPVCIRHWFHNDISDSLRIGFYRAMWNAVCRNLFCSMLSIEIDNNKLESPNFASIINQLQLKITWKRWCVIRRVRHFKNYHVNSL